MSGDKGRTQGRGFYDNGAILIYSYSLVSRPSSFVGGRKERTSNASFLPPRSTSIAASSIEEVAREKAYRAGLNLVAMHALLYSL